MICAARKDADPTASVCNVDIGNGKTGCACRIAVQAEIDAALGVETRVARVPDSARPIELGEDVA